MSISTASSFIPAEDSSDAGPLLYKEASEPQQIPASWEQDSVHQVVEDTPSSYIPAERLTPADIREVVGLLKVQTSMLALGACERIRRVSRAHPKDICESPILPELLHILDEGPFMPLAAGALSALSALALHPEGRQAIVLQGGAVPIVKILVRCDLSRPNTARAVQLLMNLAADAQNRKVLREAGACEALAQIMKVAPVDSLMEQAMGALHNVMLTDSKAKSRAVEAGVAYGLARVLSTKIDESHTLAVRSRMLLADLLRVNDLQQRIVAAATELNIRVPGMMPPAISKRSTHTNSLTPQGSTPTGMSPRVPRASVGMGQTESTSGAAEAEQSPAEPTPET